MLVFNEFGSKRNDRNGKCGNCNRYNTSPAWCQTCDPQKIALGWTSGNNNIDYCIKELQLNSTNYEDVIEWIPFNRLDNIQKIGEEFLAVWLDGVRLIQYIKEPTQSRNPSCRVKLKILHESNNLLKCLCKLKSDLIQLKNNNSKVYGLTQNTSTDEYMLVFDFKRDSIYEKCLSCNRYNTSPAWCNHVTLRKQQKDGQVVIKMSMIVLKNFNLKLHDMEI
ncbi:hypothetical protein C2G38_915589 [Gigaspora rosea]|uniref:Uncharacterized protein n=1 Tax=Gigaspora rosea TaxID=44941 RepID=A0A397VPT9_9GLOM|nr:hypothetical protein C2G38_915589 [Gigaspora rosea]